jgi:hypothetical protein
MGEIQPTEHRWHRTPSNYAAFSSCNGLRASLFDGGSQRSAHLSQIPQTSQNTRLDAELTLSF